MKATRPLQRLTYAEKMANNKEWGKENIDYYISMSNFTYLGTVNGRDTQMLYDIYNNRFPDNWFNFVKNPLNSTKNEFRNFPARIREYTIIRPNVDLFIGEFSKRPFNCQVINAGHEAWSTFLEKKKETYEQNVRQHFVNFLNEKGVNTGEDSQQAPLPSELEESFISSYKDEKAIQGQKALDIIEEENLLREMFRDLFKDWIIAGEVFTYKNIRKSDIDYERVSPIECDFDKSNLTKYIEDGEWFTRRKLVTVSDVIDRFYDELDVTDLAAIEARFGASARSPQALYTTFTRLNSNNREDLRNKVEIIHVTWKSELKVGVLTYKDPLTGQTQEVEVDENYKPDKSLGESVSWEWVTQVWEGYRVDGDIYIGIQPIPVQRNKMNRFSYCKLPYNGRRFSDTHSTNISIVELGIPYQVMHVILKYRLELTIAKNKGKIVLMDQNVIPKKSGWDEEKFFYYSDALGWGLIDRNQIGVDKTYNQYQVLDLTLFEHIEQVIKLIEQNKREWDEVLGINPYRKGQTDSSDAVGNVKQGIFQSSVISDIVFSNFEDFMKSEYKGLLDYSKFAWIDGKKKLYRTSEQRTEMLNLDSDDFLDTEFDIFVTDSTQEAEKLAALKNLAQAFAQNQAKPSMVAEILDSNNFAQVKEKLKYLEKLEQDLNQKMEQDKQTAEQEKIRISNEFESMRNQFALDQINTKADREMEKMEREYDRKQEIEYIKGDIALETYQGSNDLNSNGIPDINEIEKRAVERERILHDVTIKDKELAFKHKELAYKDKHEREKIQAEKYKANIQLKIAQENKNKLDKKK